MHFLITNDDGIDAPGLAALTEAVSLIANADFTVVAPSVEQSQCAHRVTTRDKLAVTRHESSRFSVKGTPADCVRVALFALGVKPDFVISGVNAGGNMGQDLYISGTVAAAREAAFHGLPSLALSHYLIRDVAVDWPRTSSWSRLMIELLISQQLDDGEFWNVNFPHYKPGKMNVPEIVLCHPCRAPLNVAYEVMSASPETKSLHYNASYSSRPAEADSDVAVCFSGKIALSRLRI